MKKLLEDEFYFKKVVPILKRKNLHVQVIDSDMIPDLIVSRNGKVLRAELKSINKSKKFPFDPGWRLGQYPWIKDYLMYNPLGACLILYYCGETYFLPPKKLYYEEDLVCQMEKYLQVFLTR